MAPKTLFVFFFCCCYPVFTFFEEKLLSWPFLGQLTDVSSISLKRTFLLFRCYITLFLEFLHCMEVLVFLQVITKIVTLSHSKKYFCCFVANLRCFQVFFAAKKVFACSRPYHPNSCCFLLKWKRFPVLVQNFNVLTCFRTGNGFQLFEANHVVLTLIWSRTKLLVFVGNLCSFQLFRTGNPF